VPEFLEALGFDAEIVQKGALDGLSREEIALLAPREGDFTLVTRLRDGTEVKLAEHSAAERLSVAARELEDANVDLIVLFCTGDFPELRAKVPILRPNLILERLVPALVPPKNPKGPKGSERKHSLCVVAPSPEQIPFLVKKWERTGFAVSAEAVSPYSATMAEIQRCADRVAKTKCDIVVLDCIGFTKATRAVFRAALDVPVVLPRTLAGRIAAEMLGT
jgi:protein AroM